MVVSLAILYSHPDTGYARAAIQCIGSVILNFDRIRISITSLRHRKAESPQLRTSMFYGVRYGKLGTSLDSLQTSEEADRASLSHCVLPPPPRKDDRKTKSHERRRPQRKARRRSLEAHGRGIKITDSGSDTVNSQDSVCQQNTYCTVPPQSTLRNEQIIRC